MIDRFISAIDWFVPASIRGEASELSLARNFVFTHLAGPLLGQSIAAFLFFADPARGSAFWIIEATICLFWTLPFALKALGNLRIPAYVSVQALTFVALFGSFFYGGVSSPFLPWMLVALLLGFFYLASSPLLVVGSLVGQLGVFFACFAVLGEFPERVPISELAGVALISAIAAMIYMWWMSVYYAYVISQQTAIELEAQRHRDTHARLTHAMRDAESASRAKSIFLAKMSHELRTPLNAVIGYSELLLEDVKFEDVDSTIESDIRQINTAGRQLLGLVDEVLDLRRIESNEVAIVSESFDFAALLKDVAVTVRPLMDANNNIFHAEIDPELGGACTDAVKLRQALINLLANAAKFTTNGAVTLSARRDRKPGGDWIRLQVTDTGIGIPKEDLKRLFSNFAQASQATYRDFGGTGLGLAISQKFCAMMGGGISVESEPGRGSAFTINVPAELGEPNQRLVA